jgi:enoyl-CoA hydratase/carnithine racemase
LGLVPEFASSLILPALAGRRAAARHLLLAEPFGAEQALAMGVASHVVPKGELGAALDRVRNALLAKPVEAMRLTQQLLKTGDNGDVLERIDLENRHFAERLASEEVKQAIGTFFGARQST